MTAEREVLSYERFGTAVRELAGRIAADGFRPDVVIGVARGGLVPAGALSYALGTKVTGTLNVEFYTGIEQTLPEPVILAPLLDIEAVKGRNLLVVDDVADTGRTLELVMQLLSGHGARTQSAVLYTKPGSVVTPTYAWRETDRWIEFPWSAEPTV